MKIMISWITLDVLDGANTKRDYTDNRGSCVRRIFTHQQPFRLHYNNNHRHTPICIKLTWATRFWMDRKFAWYLAISEVSANIAHGYFQKVVNVGPTL